MGLLGEILDEVTKPKGFIDFQQDERPNQLRKHIAIRRQYFAEQVAGVCEQEEKNFDLMTGRVRDDAADYEMESVKYPTYQARLGNAGSSDEEKRDNGNIMIPEFIYAGNFRREKDIITGGYFQVVNPDGLIDLSLKDEPSTNDKWQYVFRGWGQTLGEESADNADRIFISNNNHFVKAQDLVNALQKNAQDGVQILNQLHPETDKQAADSNVDYTYAEKLTEMINGTDVTVGQMIGKRDDWHIIVAKSFIPQSKLTFLPFYCDNKAQNDAIRNGESGPRSLVNVEVGDDGIISPVEGTFINLSVHVDHLYGSETHSDNSLRDLRIVTEADNTSAAGTYKFIKITIELPFNQALNSTITAQLEYVSETKQTSVYYYIDNERLSEEQVRQFNITESKEVMESGDIMQDTFNTTGNAILQNGGQVTLYQIPVVLTLKNGVTKGAASLQEASFFLNKNIESIVTLIRSVPKHMNGMNKALQNLGDGAVKSITFATNDTFSAISQGRPGLLKEEEGEEEYLQHKKIRELDARGKAGVNKRETLQEIEDNIISEMPELNCPTIFCDVKNKRGGFFISQYNPLYMQYMRIDSPLYKNEKWYRGMYVSGQNFQVGAAKRGMVILAAADTNDETSRGYVTMPNTPAFSEVIPGKKVYDPITDQWYDDKHYYVMCSDMGRILMYINNRYQIQYSDYFTIYPHTDMYMDQYSLVPGEEDSLQRGNTAKKNLRYHNLMCSSLRYNEYMQLIKNGGYENASVFVVHHTNNDTANYHINNLEIVSRYENSLFSRGFTCICLFQKQTGGKEIPLLGWANNNRKNFSQAFKLSKAELGKYGLDILTEEDVFNSLKSTENSLPKQLINSGFLFRECMTKDFRTEITDPKDVVKEIIAIVHRDSETGKEYWVSVDDDAALFTPEELLEYKLAHPEIGEMTNSPTLRFSKEEMRSYALAHPEFKAMVTAKINAGQKLNTGIDVDGKPWMNNDSSKYKNTLKNEFTPLQESIDKMRSLIKRMK